MIFTNTLTLILALAPATIFAAPTKTSSSLADLLEKRALSGSALRRLQDGACDLSNAQMPVAPTPLPAPGAGYILSHVAVGRGTQNYTCTAASPGATPSAVGAVAQLFNATCEAIRAPAVLADVTKLALTYAVPTNEIADHLLSGRHLFNGAGSPFFDLSTVAHNWGSMIGKKNASSPAPAGSAAGPNGEGSVPWLKLNGVSGDYKEVYRLNTAGGQPPKTCEGITGDFTVEYAAEYWFWR